MKLQTSVRQPEAVAAAVQNGAGEILFAAEEGKLSAWLDMLSYCRLRGVDTVLDLGWMHSDAAISASAETLAQLLRAGLTAVSFCDFGVLRMARMISPALPLHANRYFSTLDDVKILREMGVARVFLPPALMREQVAYIARNAGCEVGVLALGRACAALGFCHLGMTQLNAPQIYPCPEPCRRRYGFGGAADAHPLSARDVSLLSHMDELAEIGVGVVRVEGTLPEQAALYTRMAREAIGGSIPAEEELSTLASALERPGFSDSFYMSGNDLFAPPASGEPGAEARRMLQQARDSYAPDVENPRVPVRFYFLMNAGKPAQLAVDDYEGHTLTVSGPVPNPAFDNTLLEAEANTQWYKTQGTPYVTKSARSSIEGGISLPYALLHELRREALEKLSAARLERDQRPLGAYKPGVRHLPRSEAPKLTVHVSSAGQLTAQLIALRPERIYIPLHELTNNAADAQKLSALFGGDFSGVAVMLPSVMGDHEAAHVKAALSVVRKTGISEALCASPGQAALAASLGFKIRGDWEASNAQTLKELKHLGFMSCLLSPELSHAQLREFSHVIDTEWTIYGRIPQLITGRCALKPHMKVCCCENKNELTDQDGNHMPLAAFSGHRSIVYGARKLWLADRRGLVRHLGLWCGRLVFTTENPRECIQVTERYMGIGKYEPNSYSRGIAFDG